MKKTTIPSRNHKPKGTDQSGLKFSPDKIVCVSPRNNNGEKNNLSLLQLWSEISDFEKRESKICENHKSELLLHDLKRYAELVNDARFSARCEAYFRLQELVLNV